MEFSRPAFLIITFLMMVTITLGQNDTDKPIVEWMSSFDPKLARGEYIKTLEMTDHDMLGLFGPENDLTFKRIDRNHQITASRSVPMKFKSDNHTSMISEIAGDRIYVFSFLYSKSDKAIHRYQRIYDRRSLEPIEELKLVGSLDVKSKDHTEILKTSRSPDGNKILLWQYVWIDRENTHHHASVYDARTGLEWEHELNLPYPNNEFSVKEMFVNDNGSIMILGVKFAGEQENGFPYSLMSLNATGEIEVYELGVRDQLTWRMTCAFDTEQDIVCGGLYKINKVAGTQGVFFLKVDVTTRKFDHFDHRPYDEEMAQAHITNKRSHKRPSDDHPERIDFRNTELVLREDGSAVLIAEETAMRSYLVGTKYSEMAYFFNDMLLVNIDSAGEIGSPVLVPKHQALTPKPTSGIPMNKPRPEPEYGSYTWVMEDDAIHILFNDNEKNLEIRPGIEVAEHGPSDQVNVITKLTLRTNGEVKREAFLDPELKATEIVPLRSARMSNGHLLIYTSQGKEHRFGMLDLR